MIDFKKGDKVEFMFEWSIIKYYGTVLVSRAKSCTVLVTDPNGNPEKVCVQKRLLNWS